MAELNLGLLTQRIEKLTETELWLAVWEEEIETCNCRVGTVCPTSSTGDLIAPVSSPMSHERCQDSQRKARKWT